MGPDASSAGGDRHLVHVALLPRPHGHSVDEGVASLHNALVHHRRNRFLLTP